eukprot:gnl/Spiro4/14705_TR7919_c0_g1_i1.p1 gnl/Spiro4/14705_TR7919_c0_g1~~gnl/Spiro4/14705_TR7919_c0_g1_i1.p1  ORF type:complete len:339 (+),score=46.43 gnl/Spiro4/14705_TR7919_c0_g1_i1:56-1072(+)
MYPSVRFTYVTNVIRHALVQRRHKQKVEPTFARVRHQPRHGPIPVFWTSPNVRIRYIPDIRGFGLFAKTALAMRLVVGEYTGALLTNDDQRYLTRVSGVTSRYAYSIFPGWSIDASIFGNEMRFINGVRFSDQSNVMFHEVPDVEYKVKSLKPRAEEEYPFNRVQILTTRPIMPGEQLLLDYGNEYTAKGFKKGIEKIRREHTMPVKITRMSAPDANALEDAGEEDCLEWLVEATEEENDAAYPIVKPAPSAYMTDDQPPPPEPESPFKANRPNFFVPNPELASRVSRYLKPKPASPPLHEPQTPIDAELVARVQAQAAIPVQERATPIEAANECVHW